jgi:outer membrane protein assembly factor BamB
VALGGESGASRLLWRVRSEAILATAVTTGAFYTATGSGRVYALDTASGKRLWRRPVPGNLAKLAADDTNAYVLGDAGTIALSAAIGQTTWQHGAGTGSCLVASGDGTVYLVEQAVVVALTADLGRAVWRSRIAAGPADAIVSLAAADGAVYATVANPGAALVALDAATGTPTWRRTLPYQDPQRLVAADGVAYISGYSPDGWVLAVDTATGRQLWEFVSAEAPTVAAADGVAYLSGTGAEIRTYHVRSGLPGWNREFTSAVTAGPVLVSGLVCVGLHTGELHALDPVNGETRWGHPLGATVTDIISADGIVYAVTADSTIYAFAT